MPEIRVYFDGLCQPVNPGGIACYAFVIEKDGEAIKSGYGLAAEPFSKDATNNVAEYTALIKALEWLLENGLGSGGIEVVGDSRLVVSQLNGDYKVKNARLIPLFRDAATLLKKFKKAEVRWVPREQNREADRLTEKAYNQAFVDNPELFDKIKSGRGEKK